MRSQKKSFCNCGRESRRTGPPLQSSETMLVNESSPRRRSHLPIQTSQSSSSSRRNGSIDPTNRVSVTLRVSQSARRAFDFRRTTGQSANERRLTFSRCRPLITLANLAPNSINLAPSTWSHLYSPRAYEAVRGWRGDVVARRRAGGTRLADGVN